MPDSIITIKRIQTNAFFQVSQLAFGPSKLEMLIAVNDGDASGIVPAIL